MNDRMRVLALGGVLALAIAGAGGAQADDYRLVGSNKNQITIIDPATITLAGTGLVRVWSVSMRAPGREFKGMSVVKLFNEIDCSGRRLRVISMAAYDQGYSFMTSGDTPDATWSPVIPDSTDEAMLQFACGSNAERSRRPVILPGGSLSEIIKGIYAGPWPLN